MAVILEQIVTVLFLGLVNGGLYALVAVGLTILYGVMNVINISHGEVMVIGGYVTWIVTSVMGLHPLIGLVASMGAGAILGLAYQRFLFGVLNARMGRVRLDQRRNTYLVFTFGLSIFIQNLILLLAGPNFRDVPKFIQGSFTYEYLSFSWYWFFVLFCSVSLIALMFLFLYRTKIGLGIRAVSQDVDTAMALGVDVKKTSYVTFALALLLASAAGSIVAPILTVFPTMGFPYTVRGVSVIILGGLTSPLGALVAAFILALAESGVTFAFGTQYSIGVSFLIISAALLVKPQGLFSRRSRVG